jgi:hypothetical protein
MRCVLITLSLLLAGALQAQSWGMSSVQSLRAAVKTNSLLSFRALATLADNTDGTTYATTSFTPGANTLVLAAVVTSDIALPAVHGLTSAHGATWTVVTNATFDIIAVPLHRISLWAATFPSAVASTLTNTVGSLATGCAIRVGEFLDCDLRAGINSAIGQVLTASADIGSNPTITLAALKANAQNGVFAFFGNDLSIFGASAKAGWTLDVNTGYSPLATGLTTTYRVQTLDNVPQVTASASDWAGIAVEIIAAP